MSVAGEHIIKAKGWEQFDQASEDSSEQLNTQRLEISHKIAKLYNSKAGKEVLNLMVNQFLLTDIATPHDTQVGIGIKQGRADVVKQILAHIEISNNS